MRTQDTDNVKLWAEGTEQGEVILLEGTELDSAMSGVTVGNVTEDQWVEYTGDLAPDTEIVMRFGATASDATEEIWVDFFQILGAGADVRASFCTSPCSPNKFRHAGSSVCTPCGPGSVSDGTRPCTVCPAGTYAHEDGLTGMRSCR